MAGLLTRFLDLLFAIVCSIHLETMVSEKMIYQTNCKIMRLVLQTQPIIRIYNAEKFVLSHVYIMLKSWLDAWVVPLPQGKLFQGKNQQFLGELLKNTIRK